MKRLRTKTDFGSNLASNSDHGRPLRVPDLILEPVFTGRKKLVNFAGIAIWVIALGFFWTWWFSPEHIVSMPRFIVISLILIWMTLIPAYFIFIFDGALIPKKTNDRLPGRIAMIVTKAPSEPFSIVKTTLLAMLDQQGYVYDTWLADEDPSEETAVWCKKHGVRVSCRKGIEDYHRQTWPRRTRCKEGNLAYFYDQYGYQDYDFVCQFDADHVPDPTYLQEILRPFADPGVGYVSAPSICDNNVTSSWSARGRVYVEASLHGSLQAGYNNKWAPLCIGSHYAVRTAALKQVGGLGPELAEDHSTTLLMNAGGWRGVHAINAIAHGDGPSSFSDLVVQEFQWSRSLVTIFLQYSPTYIPKLKGRVKSQFLFSQLWYPMFSTAMLVMFILPIYALVTGQNYVNVTYFEFLAYSLPISTSLLILAFWWRSTGTFRPQTAKIVSWEGLVFLFARWPWSLLGSITAVSDWWRGSFVDFRITPKGDIKKSYLPVRFFAPYAFLSLASSLPAIIITDAGSASGFYLFCIVNAIAYGLVLAVIFFRHARENKIPLLPHSFSNAFQLSLLVCTLILPGIASYQNGSQGLKAFNVGIDAFSLTKTTFRISGAGRGSDNKTVVRFRFQWKSDQNLKSREIKEKQ